MPLHWFAPPVTVETDKAGVSYAVTSVEKAAEFLMSWRDDDPGPAWRLAAAVCMRAMSGEATPAEARAAFEAAAKEVGKLL